MATTGGEAAARWPAAPGREGRSPHTQAAPQEIRPEGARSVRCELQTKKTRRSDSPAAPGREVARAALESRGISGFSYVRRRSLISLRSVMSGFCYVRFH